MNNSIENRDKLIRADFFNRRENKNFNPENVACESLYIPAHYGLKELLEAAWAAGISKGSHRSGIFEIQTDLGIWAQINGKKLDWTKPEKYIFKTWEELEAEE